ncbi:hypothetical protein HP439_16495 [Sphingobacterium shayense]|uniref:hypothetical protein n=1 Tax=Sphingobacterium shayense TaxID=626343 RepID=UPI001556622E|nr:hypothetical protein [Sphingobacterium shayense]NQD72327.1 hypothetical protein [Sphingobacterium shayense]
MFKKVIFNQKKISVLVPPSASAKKTLTEMNSIQTSLERHPRLTLSVMITLMLASSCYLLLKELPAKGKESPTAALMAPAGESMKGIVNSAAALSEMIALQQQMDVLLAKDSLLSGDSINIERALDQIQLIEKRLGWSGQPGSGRSEYPNKTTKP